MTQFIIYKKPEVEDKYYDEYPWERYKQPYNTREQARENMPTVGSEVGEGYTFRIFEFEEDEDIPSSIPVSEVSTYSSR